MKKIHSLLSFVLVSLSLSPASSFSEENYRGSNRFFIEGEVTTGFNVSKSEPMYDLGGVLGGFGFHFVFAYAPGEDQPDLITEQTDENTLLASGVDINFYAPVGVDPSIIDPDAINVPLRDIPVILDGLGTRAKLDPISRNNYKSGATLSYPSDALTVADWYKAKGYMKIKCHRNGGSNVVIKMAKLIPNGMYTVWGMFGADNNGDGVRDGFFPLPFGGVPNVFTADERGLGYFKRKLPFCPQEDADMMTVEIAYQADGTAFAAAPAIFPTLNDAFLGIIPQPSQLSFNINLEDF